MLLSNDSLVSRSAHLSEHRWQQPARVGECLRAIFRARARNVASIPCSLSLIVRYFLQTMPQRWKLRIIHEQILHCAGHSWWIFEHQSRIWGKPENALEADLKWSLWWPIADWSRRYALSLFCVSVPLWDLRGDTLTFDFDTCAYNQRNQRVPNNQVRMTCSDREEKLHTYTYVYV